MHMFTMAVFGIFVLFCLALLPGFECVTWSTSTQDNDIIYVCSNKTLTLPWSVTLDNGDVIEDIQWFYSGRSEELIAVFAHNHFIPQPAFSGRVQQVGNAGVSISHVHVLDSGNFSVEVITRTAGGNVIILRRSAYLHAIDGLQTEDGELHVSEQTDAEYSSTTGQYHVVLHCGTFTYLTPPTFHATWLTPSGVTLTSTRFQNNSFHLFLPNPVRGGLYTCRLPAPDTCVHGNSPAASIEVDTMEARMAVVEARQTHVESVLQARVDQLEVRNTAQDARIRQLEAQTNAAKQGIDRLNEHVSFHARLDSHTRLSTGFHIIPSIVVNNQGHAYDATSGMFTAPLNGTYCFMASTVSPDYNYIASMYLMVDDAHVDYVYVDGNSCSYPAGSVQAVVHLASGQRVWLKSDGNSYYWGTATAFSGFLVNADP